MEKLITIQKREKLNEVFAVDGKGNGGANHVYEIISIEKDGSVYEPTVFAEINFQDGARKIDDSVV